MKYFTAWLDGWRRLFQFDGRASRLGFWSFFIGNIVGPIVLSLIGQIAGSSTIIWIASVWSFLALVLSISVAVRRLHDHHFSGLWLLIALIPGLGILILLIGFALPGDPGPNRYGAQPGHRANTDNNLGAA